MSTAVKRACDACHRRKVKCDGINPCRNCSSAQLTCTYNAIPQKKGPKGSRAKVISELRETQRATSLSAKVQSRLNGINSPPCTPSLQPNTGLLSNELIKDSIEFFFAHMYPTMPILNRQRLEQQSLYMDQSLDTYTLLTSLCAFVLLQPGMVMPGNDPLFEHPGANITSSHLLLEEAMRVRKGYDYTESPTLNTLCTSYFIFGCYYALEMHEKAWYHLREAATLAHMGGMTQEEKFMQFDGIESSRRRRLYWLVFVAERAYALKYNRPLSLPTTINPPMMNDDPSDPLAHQLNGFIMMVNLFRPFDDAFMLFWNKTRNECSPSYMGALQKQASEMNSPYMNGGDSQIGDMRTNQQWMKTVNWHLSMQSGCVPPNSEDMSYQYPLNVSRDLMSITSQFSTQSTDVLGVPLVAKLMEIACALTDVLAMQPSSGDPFSIGPQQHLQALLQLVSILRGGQHHFLPLLLSKVHDILPRLANPMLQRVPENICNIDIFDGFGNAGMAQPPVMTDFSKAEQFKSEPYTPAPVPRIDDIGTDSGSSTGAPAGTEMSSPFPMANSPAVVSPSMEYPHNQNQQVHMNGFNSMPDMVINPLGQGQQPAINQSAPVTTQAEQQHSGFQSQSITPNHNIHGQMPHLNQNMSQSQGIGAIGHRPQGSTHNPSYNHMMMSSILNRQPPQRTNSFSMHPQTPQVPRTVADFHALQRTNSDNVTMTGMSMNQMGGDMDFSGMR